MRNGRLLIEGFLVRVQMGEPPDAVSTKGQRRAVRLALVRLVTRAA